MRPSTLVLVCALIVAAPNAFATEARDPYTHFFHPNTGDLRAELADAKGAGKKAVFLFYDLAGNELVRIVGPVRGVGEFLLLGEFISSGAYKTRKFAQYRQERRQRKGS